MISCTQGFEFKIKVDSFGCKFVASDGLNKIVLDDVTQDNDEFFIIASADITKDWHSGQWTYQILGTTGIDEQGILKVIPNLEFATDITAQYWRTVLKAIDDRIAGRAESATSHVTVRRQSIKLYDNNRIIAA